MARFAVLTMFFLNGFVFSNWAARIPDIQDKLALSEGDLGFVLLSFSAGVITALPLIGGLIARFGSRNVSVGGGIIYAVLLPVLALAPSPLWIAPALFVFGLSTSAMDVAMNAQAVAVERRLHKPIMSSFHASFSIGGVVGAVMGALLRGQAVTPETHFLITTIITLVILALIIRWLLIIDGERDEAGGGATFRLPQRALWGLGAVAFASTLGEGAIADWSAVYMENVVNAQAGVAALGFAAFSLTMTVGRLLGDWISTRFDPVQVARSSGVISGAGLLLVVLVPEVPFALIGFAAVGIGLSVIVPLTFSAAGNLPDVPSGAGIAGVATIGYTGFLAGPPVIGVIAEATSLQFALGLVAVIIMSLVLTARSLRRAETVAS